MVHTSYSLEETRSLAERFVHVLRSMPSNVIGFSGDLGSGKTAFTKCVAEILGITNHVTSPTFVIQKKYPVDKEGFPFKTLVHIDAYRLESGAELSAMKFKEEASDPANLILIEWPEKVIDMLPKETPIVRFSFISEHVRTIEFPDMMGI